MTFKLLTPGYASPKLAKSAGSGHLTAILYLSPHTTAGGPDVCPAATPACRATCLVTTAGRARFTPAIRAARVRRTRLLHDDRAEFMRQLYADLGKLVKQALAAGLRPACRLNGGSDLVWTAVYRDWPPVQFYEYTKRPNLLWQLKFYDNVHVTFSYSGANWRIAKQLLLDGHNVAVVFGGLGRTRPFPPTLDGHPVVDGDVTDLRWLDPRGVVVGLRAKGDAHSAVPAGLNQGFVVDPATSTMGHVTNSLGLASVGKCR